MERHKGRLKAELTKARVRRACPSLQELQAVILREKKAALGPESITEALYPRWIRINNVKTTRDLQFKATFGAYQQVDSLTGLTTANQLYVDANIPDLIAVAPGASVSSLPAYKSGEIILQDKASCFPAYLLLGDITTPWEGDLVDGCAAPGNKTTHLASLLEARKSTRNSDAGSPQPSKIISMDASVARSKTLQKMVSVAGADKIVTILAGQDFLALDPTDERFAHVSGLLLDPSCSGSGIIGRDDVPKLALPETRSKTKNNKSSEPHGKKRKRRDEEQKQESDDVEEKPPSPLNPERLLKLANLQTHIVEHALGFPGATRVTYSTCSTHVLENEAVVSRVLASDVAQRGGWRIMRRDDQPEGLRKWKHRGIRQDASNPTGTEDSVSVPVELSDEQLDACLRCWPGDDEGTGGFFVAGLVRDATTFIQPIPSKLDGAQRSSLSVRHNDIEGDEEWEGFSD